jgi:hypothetical protein
MQVDRESREAREQEGLRTKRQKQWEDGGDSAGRTESAGSLENLQDK